MRSSCETLATKSRRDQQPQVLGIGDQAQAQAQLGIDRRGGIDQGLGIAAGGEPVGDRQRLQASAERSVDVARVVQAEQRGRRGVEPGDALGVAFDHDDRIGKRIGDRAVGAQHPDQAPLVAAHVLLAAMQQAIKFIPDAVALRWFETLARGQPQQDAAQLPVMPCDHAERGDREHQPDAAADAAAARAPAPR